jgi:hypothetical protein
MTNQKQEFIEAIKNDEYYAWHLTEDVWIHTDVEFDGTFLPSVHAHNVEEYTKQEIEDIMQENDVWDVFEWDILEWDRNNNCWYPVGINCEYETVERWE